MPITSVVNKAKHRFKVQAAGRRKAEQNKEDMPEVTAPEPEEQKISQATQEERVDPSHAEEEQPNEQDISTITPQSQNPVVIAVPEKKAVVSEGKSIRAPSASQKRKEKAPDLELETVSLAELCKSKYSKIGEFPLPKRKKKKVADMTEQDVEQQATQETYTGPRVRVVNGQIVLDETAEMLGNDAQNNENMQVVEEDHEERHITAGSFMKRTKGKKWKQEETDLFYEGLSMFGTDFEMIARMFEDKTRRHIKLKFNKEERENIYRVNKALKEKKPVDMSKLIS